MALPLLGLLGGTVARTGLVAGARSLFFGTTARSVLTGFGIGELIDVQPESPTDDDGGFSLVHVGLLAVAAFGGAWLLNEVSD